MNKIRAVAGRELRAYFNSPIAYVFLAVFAGAALFTFFNVNAFFSRGRADLRGLIDAIPSKHLDNIARVDGRASTPRVLLWMIAGHEQHHLEVLRDRYGLK